MGFGPPATPRIIKNLMIVNAVVYVAQYASPIVTQLGAITPALVWGERFLWQPVTYMWLHSTYSLLHIAGSRSSCVPKSEVRRI